MKWPLVGELTHDVTPSVPLDDLDVEVIGDASASYDVQPSSFDDGGAKTTPTSIDYRLTLTPSGGELTEVGSTDEVSSWLRR